MLEHKESKSHLWVPLFRSACAPFFLRFDHISYSLTEEIEIITKTNLLFLTMYITRSNSINLHTTLPFRIRTSELGLVETVDAFAAVLLVVAAFAHPTPPGAVPERPQPFPFSKIRRLFGLGYFLIRQFGAV